MIRALPLAREIPLRAAALLVGAVLLAAAAGLTALLPARVDPSAPAPSLAQQLEPGTWALAIPVSWLSAPIPGVRQGDVIDLLGTRAGERATAREVASGLRLRSADERTLVVELTPGDASEIADARAQGLALIPLLRSGR